MEREASTLVFQQHARVATGEVDQRRARIIEHSLINMWPGHGPIRTTTLGAMQPGSRQRQRKEEAVDLGKASSTDKRERSTFSRRGQAQGISQRCRDNYRIGSGRDLEQRAIDVEEQREIVLWQEGAAQSHG